MTSVVTDTYTSRDLCARYGCAQVTIRKREAEDGFPTGVKFGRKLIYNKRAVHKWESEHLPALQPEKVMEESYEDSAEWDRRRRRYLLERDERAAREASKKPIPPPPKKKPRKPH